MKKITLLLMLLVASFGFSQDVLQDFETPGAIDGGFGSGVSTAEVADPAMGGTNGTVAQIIAGAGGDIWQGANIVLDQNVDLTQTLPADRQMEIDVYSDSMDPISMLVRVRGPVNDEASAVVTHPGGGVWATLTATFDTSLEGKPIADGVYTSFVVFPNWDTNTDNFINPAIARTVYFDNISGQAAAVDPCENGMMDPGEEGVDCGGTCPNACPVPPATAAPDPPARDAGDVLSVFSGGVYTDVSVSGVNTFAGASLDNFTIDVTDDTRRLTAPNPGGGAQFEFFGGSPALDLTDFTHAHIDFYVEGDVSPGQLFQIFLLNFPNYPDGAGSYNTNTSFDVNASGSGVWVSGDVALDDFNNGMAARDQVALVQVVAAGSPSFGPIYFDNLYFYKLNDTCADADPILLDGSTVTISNIGATDSGVDATCDSGIISDVWYSFVATSTEEAYFQTDAPNLSVWSGACGSLTEIACNPGTSAVSGLVDGTTYYVRVNDDGTARAPGNFSLAANESTFSTNDFDLNSIRVYPNPTNDSWNIEGANITIDTIEVYDILGKRVQTLSPNSQQTAIDASGLKTGLYLAKLYSGDAVRTIKLVKN
ncbi:T9SS type A sorting domain-containing protein [uncultured Winogradskyella sp.]|uniref:T9SS type A sorting domain-containing protein n=1 Tax=uncultured Winogradskyella sp. TaxID=395353 RepID=UPI002617A23D|nr:T9SS type A sorting domain-containing protein [uncultured Winogradskyella sp.]